VHAAGGVVYHDVTERKWADKGLEGGVDGLIAVNRPRRRPRRGFERRALIDELGRSACRRSAPAASGDERDFAAALRLGYAGVQMGTRFIATPSARQRRLQAGHRRAGEDDIVLSERITGVPVAVIRTPYIERMGLTAGPIARRLLRGRRTKHWMRTIYALRSLWQLKRASLDERGERDYWQAGKSVAGVRAIEPVAVIMRRFAAALRAEAGERS
jgi:nitronate monooxygenase